MAALPLALRQQIVQRRQGKTTCEIIFDMPLTLHVSSIFIKDSKYLHVFRFVKK